MTEIYGQSDDNIYFEGDYTGQVCCWQAAQEKGVLLMVNDGTMLKVKYGKHDRAIWEICMLKQGSLFDRIEHCLDENADRYSDTAIFKEGVVGIWAATEWELVQ